MQDFYKTSEIAKIIGIHPNTVRLYEQMGLVSAAYRLPNGYRAFNRLHLAQFRLARTALQVEVLQNGLRRQIISILKTTAKKHFDKALSLTDLYLHQIHREKANAEEAILIARQFLSPASNPSECSLTRQETAERLQISIDTLRNWERNGLLEMRRQQNGRRFYTANDIDRLKLVRVLRCANYSLTAILRLLTTASDKTDLRSILNTPGNEDMISACDQLLTSLDSAEKNALAMHRALIEMKKIKDINPPL